MKYSQDIKIIDALSHYEFYEQKIVPLPVVATNHIDEILDHFPINKVTQKMRTDLLEATAVDYKDLVEENYILALNKEMYTEFIVEGGKYTLEKFLESGLFDAIQVEVGPYPCHEGVPAPTFSTENLICEVDKFCDSTFIHYKKVNARNPF